MTFFEARGPGPVDLPRLRTDLKVDVLNERDVLIVDGGQRRVLEDPVIVALLPLLDGTRNAGELAAELAGIAPFRKVVRTISALTSAGLLVDGAPSDDEHETAWFDSLGIGPARGRENLARTAVAIGSVGGASVPAFADDLRSQGLTVVDGLDADLLVIWCTDHLDTDLEGINRTCLDSGTPWVLAGAARSILWLGPLFVPGQTGCWRCMAQRLEGNRQMERHIQTMLGVAWANPTVTACSPTTTRAASAIVATEIARLAAGGEPSLGFVGRLVTMDLVGLSSESHTLVRQPQCPACGDPQAHRCDRPIELRSQQKVAGVDSGHRATSAQQTVSRLEHHVSPVLGAITNLQRLEAGDSELSHNWVSGHNFAMLSNSTAMLKKNMRGLSGGKGRSDTQAKASAMCEALERYSGVWRGDEPVVRASAIELGTAALDFDEILGFSEHQRANLHEWNHQQRSGLHIVSPVFDRARVIDWTQVWSLTKNEPRFVPSAYCYFGHPDGIERNLCSSDANGNAAGNTLEEAILQGLLELVERDSVAIWWYNRLRVPEVDLGSLGDPYTDQLLKFYASMDRDLHLLDITTDLGIPAFAAVSRRLGHPVEDPLLGFGSHLEGRLGALRALTECNQFLPGVVERDSEGNTIYGFEDLDTVEWFSLSTFASDPYLVPDANAPSSDVRAMADLVDEDIAIEVRTCVDLLERAGLEVFVLDQSRPDLDIAVAKVIVPGLCHFWRRLGPKRLYEVPVRMGRLPEPTAEPDLNPKSVFF